MVRGGTRRWREAGRWGVTLRDAKVGDTIHVLPDANKRGGGVETVSAVGRKWLHTEAGGCRRSFDMASGHERGDGAGGYCVALTVAEHAAYLARLEPLKRLDTWCRAWNSAGKLTTDQIVRILAIIDEPKDGAP
jgi:hypothetical protein